MKCPLGFCDQPGMVVWPCPHRNFKMFADDSQLDPQRYKKGQEYEIEGELTGTNCVIVKKDSKGERSAISAARFEQRGQK